MWIATLVAASAALAQPSNAPEPRPTTGGCPGAIVFFDTDSTTLDERSTDALSGTMRWLGQVLEAGAWLEISGGADDRGSADYNLALSRRRAEAVRDWYARQGIAADKLEVRAWGESRPLALPRPNEPIEETRRQNRYVNAAPVMPIDLFRRFFPPGGPIC